MLTHLTIHNYALITELEIDFGKGFSVLTGETGAGKSIILGALSLLMGGRADTKAITEGEQKCIIEGTFGLSGYGLEGFFEAEGLDYCDECTIRRELTANGKSRSFINDTPVTLQVLKPLSARLIDIHSQHQNLLLSDEGFCLQIVDSLAGNEKERRAYSEAYTAYSEAATSLRALQKEAADAKKNADYIQYQHDQLEEAQLKEGEMEELETMQQLLANAEDIRAGYAEAASLLRQDDGEGAVYAIKDAIHALRRIGDFLPKDEQLLERLESAQLELQDMADTCERELENTEADPSRLEATEERISELRSLLRKFGKETEEELIAFYQELDEQLGRNQSYDFDLQQLEKRCTAALDTLKKAAEKLTTSRQKVGPLMKKSLEDRLSKLGVKHAAIELKISKLDNYEETGIDKTEILFAANKNQNLRNVSEIASGGEMARLMLSIKALVADTQGLPTIIFDEVDTGVSGEVADEMGAVMAEMAKGRQILSITHLPQIAAKGQQHYKVYKQDSDVRTETHIRCLTQEERIREIATLLSGSSITPEALSNAKQLLGI